MPPRAYSRHTFTEVEQDEQGRLRLTDRVPYRFRPLDDNVFHVVREGDTLFNLAGRYFAEVGERPAGLWWVIADFQPEPIHDPTLRLATGATLVVPSARTILEAIFSEKRRAEAAP